MCRVGFLISQQVVDSSFTLRPSLRALGHTCCQQGASKRPLVDKPSSINTTWLNGVSPDSLLFISHHKCQYRYYQMANVGLHISLDSLNLLEVTVKLATSPLHNTTEEMGHKAVTD